MNGEYEVLDLLFEALPADVPRDLYGVRPDLPRPEFYIEVNGQCWRVLAEPHPHGAPMVRS